MESFIIFYLIAGITVSRLLNEKVSEEERFFSEGYSWFELYFIIPIFWIWYLAVYFNNRDKN